MFISNPQEWLQHVRQYSKEFFFFKFSSSLVLHFLFFLLNALTYSFFEHIPLLCIPAINLPCESKRFWKTNVISNRKNISLERKRTHFWNFEGEINGVKWIYCIILCWYSYIPSNITIYIELPCFCVFWKSLNFIKHFWKQIEWKKPIRTRNTNILSTNAYVAIYYL